MPADETTPAESWTVGRLLTWTTDYLRDKHCESPRLDAEVLLAHARGCQRIELYTAFEEEAEEPLRLKFRELVQRRAAGTPVAYLVGHREFFSLSFEVSPDVLIPRPETELLVVRALDLAKTLGDLPSPNPSLKGRGTTIADVGTGSGVLAVCCAKHLPACKVIALEISRPALEVAKRNAKQHEVADRIDFVCSDLFGDRPTTAEFDIIVSNPPYVASSEFAGLEVGVRNHEPRLALDGGEQGVDVINRLIPQAVKRLKPGGWLLMEGGPANASHIKELLSAESDLEVQETILDLAGLPRVIQAQRKEV